MAERKSIEERFWSKVNFFGPTPSRWPALPSDREPGNCWIWTAQRQSSGYGRFSLNHHVSIGAHRFAWMWANGCEVPPETPFVCHECDNRACVRPDHLRADTHDGNMAEMVEKKRSARGDRHGVRLHPDRMSCGEAHIISKITESDVREIRRRALTETREAIAADYPLSRVQISRIARRIAWVHVV